MTLRLAWALLLRRLRSPMRVLLLLALGGQDLAHAFLSGDGAPADAALAAIFAVVFGAGLIGQERAEGSLPLLLTRPVGRARIVAAAWLAAAAAGLASWLLLTLLRTAATLHPQVDPACDAGLWLQQGLGALSAALGLSAAVVFFGVLARGLSGLALHGGVAYGLIAVAAAAQESGRPQLRGLADELLGLVTPSHDLAALLSPGGFSLLELVTPVSNATLLLLAACILLGRRQLSYSAGD